MDFRQKLDQSRSRNYNGEPAAELEQVDDGPYFETERGRTPVCLELRLAGGGRIALPYAYFTEIRFDMEKGIEMLTAQKRIHITGRSLGKLFDCLIAYRVRYVQVNIGNDAQEDGLFVNAIAIEDVI